MNLSYLFYEAAHAAVTPARAVTDVTRLVFNNPGNPLTYTNYGRTVSAVCEMFERTTRRYGKPAFELPETTIDGVRVPIQEQIVWKRPFCSVIRFARTLPPGTAPQPKLLIVAPLSGHYATLLRGTVQAFLATHDVYITDWADARKVPYLVGRFDLDNYIDTIIGILDHLGSGVHTLAVCQPAVPVIAAAARMAADNNPNAPASMILMGGPIDTRRSPTKVNQLALERGTDWFRKNCIVRVPMSSPGFMREVYPGFLQLSGFMAMNIDRHMSAHWDMFSHLVKGDGDSAEKQVDFYDEYLAVLDLTAEFYLQTIETVFVQHQLPKGTMMHRDKPVDLTQIRNTALMTIEGENDDISGVGQTQAAHDLCPNIPEALKTHHLQTKVGHYGVFNGSRFRQEIAPRIRDFIQHAQTHVTSA